MESAMVKTTSYYKGQKHCEILHEPSGSKIATDAPKDNHGKGETFSPTDLVGVALGSCILTTMAIVAERDGFDFTEAKAEVEKIMADKPRRIQGLRVKITLPAAIEGIYRKKLEETAKHCPVHKSLNKEIEIPIDFNYV